MTATLRDPNDRRCKDRRFTDSEIEEILEYSRGYVNGQKRRQKVLGITLGTLVAITTLINFWIVSPLREDINTLRLDVKEIEVSVRSHHENQARDYVTKEDEEKVHAELKSLEDKVDRLATFMIEIHSAGKR